MAPPLLPHSQSRNRQVINSPSSISSCLHRHTLLFPYFLIFVFFWLCFLSSRLYSALVVRFSGFEGIWMADRLSILSLVPRSNLENVWIDCQGRFHHESSLHTSIMSICIHDSHEGLLSIGFLFSSHSNCLALEPYGWEEKHLRPICN